MSTTTTSKEYRDVVTPCREDGSVTKNNNSNNKSNSNNKNGCVSAGGSMELPRYGSSDSSDLGELLPVEMRSESDCEAGSAHQMVESHSVLGREYLSRTNSAVDTSLLTTTVKEVEMAYLSSPTDSSQGRTSSFSRISPWSKLHLENLTVVSPGTLGYYPGTTTSDLNPSTKRAARNDAFSIPAHPMPRAISDTTALKPGANARRALSLAVNPGLHFRPPPVRVDGPGASHCSTEDSHTKSDSSIMRYSNDAWLASPNGGFNGTVNGGSELNTNSPFGSRVTSFIGAIEQGVLSPVDSAPNSTSKRKDRKKKDKEKKKKDNNNNNTNNKDSSDNNDNSGSSKGREGKKKSGAETEELQAKAEEEQEALSLSRLSEASVASDGTDTDSSIILVNKGTASQRTLPPIKTAVASNSHLPVGATNGSEKDADTVHTGKTPSIGSKRASLRVADAKEEDASRKEPLQTPNKQSHSNGKKESEEKQPMPSPYVNDLYQDEAMPSPLKSTSPMSKKADQASSTLSSAVAPAPAVTSPKPSITVTSTATNTTTIANLANGGVHNNNNNNNNNSSNTNTHGTKLTNEQKNELPRPPVPVPPPPHDENRTAYYRNYISLTPTLPVRASGAAPVVGFDYTEGTNSTVGNNNNSNNNNNNNNNNNGNQNGLLTSPRMTARQRSAGEGVDGSMMASTSNQNVNDITMSDAGVITVTSELSGSTTIVSVSSIDVNEIIRELWNVKTELFDMKKLCLPSPPPTTSPRDLSTSRALAYYPTVGPVQTGGANRINQEQLMQVLERMTSPVSDVNIFLSLFDELVEAQQAYEKLQGQFDTREAIAMPPTPADKKKPLGEETIDFQTFLAHVAMRIKGKFSNDLLRNIFFELAGVDKHHGPTSAAETGGPAAAAASLAPSASPTKPVPPATAPHPTGESYPRKGAATVANYSNEGRRDSEGATKAVTPLTQDTAAPRTRVSSSPQSQKDSHTSRHIHEEEVDANHVFRTILGINCDSSSSTILTSEMPSNEDVTFAVAKVQQWPLNNRFAPRPIPPASGAAGGGGAGAKVRASGGAPVERKDQRKGAASIPLGVVVREVLGHRLLLKLCTSRDEDEDDDGEQSTTPRGPQVGSDGLEHYSFAQLRKALATAGLPEDVSYLLPEQHANSSSAAATRLEENYLFPCFLNDFLLLVHTLTSNLYLTTVRRANSITSGGTTSNATLSNHFNNNSNSTSVRYPRPVGEVTHFQTLLMPSGQPHTVSHLDSDLMSMSTKSGNQMSVMPVK